MNHLSDDTIFRYLEGDLEEAELDRIEEHMEICDECAEQLAILAELRTELPDDFLPVRAPSNGFADRVMEQVLSETEAPHPAELPEQANKVVTLPLRRKQSPRLEVLTRFMTAAVVTGFMVIGSSQVQDIPMLGHFSTAVGQTGGAVSQGTVKAYVEFRGFLSHVSTEVFDREGQ